MAWWFAFSHGSANIGIACPPDSGLTGTRRMLAAEAFLDPNDLLYRRNI
jgi:hypothetical protein